MAVLIDQDKYRQSFDPLKYLNSFFGTAREHKEVVQCMLSFYKSLHGKNLKLLELGGGPSLRDVLAASSSCAEIVFTDYCEQNLGEIRRWLDKDAKAFDWSPFTRLVLEGEGLEPTQEAVKKREEHLRSAISTVAHCDLAESPPVALELSGPYDVVNCDNVLDAVCGTPHQFYAAVDMLSKLAKKDGGHLVVVGGLDTEFYPAGVDFPTPLDIDEEDFRLAFEKAGLVDIKVQIFDENIEAADYKERGIIITGKRQ